MDNKKETEKDDKKQAEGFEYEGNPIRDEDWYKETERERIMEEDEGDHWIWE